MRFLTTCTLFVCLLLSCSGPAPSPTNNEQIDKAPEQGFYTKENHDPNPPLQNWSKENKVTVIMVEHPDQLHPTNGNSFFRSFIHTYMHRFIMRRAMNKVGVSPDVVKSMPEISEDNKVFTYELADHTIWPDGSSLTVEDILFTFKVNKCPFVPNAHNKTELNTLVEVRAVEGQPRKFQVIYKKPYFLAVEMMTTYPILKKDFFDPNGVFDSYSYADLNEADFSEEQHFAMSQWAKSFNDVKYARTPEYLLGMGPYKVVNWKSGDEIILQRNDQYNDETNAYFDGKNDYLTAYPDEIIFKINRDPNGHQLVFKNQQGDVSIDMTINTVNKLTQDPEFRKNYFTEIVPSYTYYYAGFNCIGRPGQSKSAFSDVYVRKACALATPVDRINREVFQGTRNRIATNVNPLKKDFVHPDIIPTPYDLSLAENILNKEGWVDADGDGIREKTIDGKKVKLQGELVYMTTSVEWKEMAMIIKESWNQIGIDLTITPLAGMALYKKVMSHDFDIMMGAWTETSTPQDFSAIWHSKAWRNNSYNFTGFGTEESDSVIDNLKHMVTLEERLPAVHRLQEIVHEHQPYIFLLCGTVHPIIHKRFENATMYVERPYMMINRLKLRK